MMEETPESTRQYFNNQVQPVFSSLMSNLVHSRPQDIHDYILKYFSHENRPTIQGSDSQNDQDRFEQVSLQQFQIRKAIKRQNTVRKMRKGVSAQSNQMFTNQRRPINLRPSGIKQEKIQIMIRFYFMNSFLFQDLQFEQKQLLINSMVTKNTSAGEVIIKEGQFGDSMYFIQTGLFQCSIQDNNSPLTNFRVLKNYQTGDSFGELCLLHAAKRQASVVSRTQGILHQLNRQLYRHVKKMSIVKKRELHLQNLKKVNIFHNLHSEDFQKLCDLLNEVYLDSDEYVLHQGDMGTKFYIVIEGLLAAKNSQEDTFYQYYKQGDYFGQLALITNKPRQVSVQAVTKCRLVYLSNRIFLNVINRDKAQHQINNKYKSKPQTLARRKKVNIQSKQ